MTNRQCKCFRRGFGFTLVELLVAIGIIAILLAILLPVLSKAIARAHMVHCLSNQRQLMQAIITYTVDNGGYLPPPNWEGGLHAGPPMPPGWLYDPSAVLAAGGFAKTDAQRGVLYPYINSLDVYHCPMDDTTWGSGTVQIVTSYVMNGAVIDFGYADQPEKLSAFKGTAALMWELPSYPGQDQVDPGSINDGSNWPSEGTTTRHNNGTTIGFADGHVEVWTWTQFTNEWYYNYPGQLWCAAKWDPNLEFIKPQGPFDGGKSTAPTWPSSLPVQPANSN